MHWSTKLTPAPMKRMIIWMYFISPAWLRLQSSFPLEKTTEDNKRHRGDSLMSNCLENKAQKDGKYCGYLIFLKKIHLNFSKVCETGYHTLSIFSRKQLLCSHNMRQDLWGGTLVSKTNPVPLQDPVLPAADLAKKGQAATSLKHRLQCFFLLSGSLNALWRSPTFFSFLCPSWCQLKQQLGGQEVKMGRNNNDQWKSPSTGCRTELKWQGTFWGWSGFILQASREIVPVQGPDLFKDLS